MFRQLLSAMLQKGSPHVSFILATFKLSTRLSLLRIGAWSCSRLHQDGCEQSLPRSSPIAEVQLCGKMEMLDRILLRLHQAKHKVSTCFSTSVRYLLM